MRPGELERPLEHAGRGTEVAARERAADRDGEAVAGRECQFRIGPTERGEVMGRLLEVVAEDLVELDESLAVLLEPRSETAVQLGAGRLRERVVGGVTDQQMAEPVGVVALELRLVGPDELLAHEREEPPVDRAVAVGGERGHRTAVEGPALDRSALEHRPLGRVELVEPRRKQRLDRRRHLHTAAAALAHEREHLLHEERVSLRHLDDPLSQVVGDAAELREQQLRLRRVQRLEQHRRRVPLAAAPR